MPSLRSALILSLLGAKTFAQTYTSCNPTENSSCPADTGLATRTYSVDFTRGESSNWTVTAGSITYATSGAEFTINKSGDAPTIETNFYIFFGVISFFLKAAPGTGIVSSAILESDDLDEIDFEWLGGTADSVETNYFGKGNTTSYDRAIYYDVDDSQSTVHNYTILWTSSAITWYIDSTAVRTLNYNDAVSGKNFPQTPMRVKLGIWAGGDSSNAEGTIEWAGGETDYNDGPFTMTVEKVEINNYNPASTYTYGDETGDYTSIVKKNGTSASASSGTETSSSTTTTEGEGNSTSASATTTGMWWTASASAVKAASESSGHSMLGDIITPLTVLLAGISFGMHLI